MLVPFFPSHDPFFRDFFIGFTLIFIQYLLVIIFLFHCGVLCGCWGLTAELKVVPAMLAILHLGLGLQGQVLRLFCLGT